MSWIDRSEIIKRLHHIAPERWSLDGDNTGLQVGRTTGEIKKCLVTLDVTEKVIEKAIKESIGLIISHHPVFNEPVNALTPDIIGEPVYNAIQKDITIYTCHSNLDAAPDVGVNVALTERLALGFEQQKTLFISAREKFNKIAVFVPEDYKFEVQKALVEAGAGAVNGDYSGVTFTSEGIGAFYSGEAATPYFGEPGSKQEVREYKIESIVLNEQLNHVIDCVHEVHPYEEPAIDVMPLKEPERNYGIGLVGDLSRYWETEAFLDRIEHQLGTSVSITGEKPEFIHKVALCGGSGGKLVPQVLESEADVFITGDIKYHEALEASEKGLFLIDAGHRETELPVIEKLTFFIREQLKGVYETEVMSYHNCESVKAGRF